MRKSTIWSTFPINIIGSCVEILNEMLEVDGYLKSIYYLVYLVFVSMKIQTLLNILNSFSIIITRSYNIDGYQLA